MMRCFLRILESLISVVAFPRERMQLMMRDRAALMGGARRPALTFESLRESLAS
jgi:hypothetical protein